MIVTHTEQVYDIYKLLALLKLTKLIKRSSITFHLCINTDRLGTKVRFLVYTTMGPINVNFQDFKIADFSTEYNPVFPETELDSTTERYTSSQSQFTSVTKWWTVKVLLAFEKLKEYVIDSSIGDRKLPITNKQLDYSGAQNNFQ